MGVSGIANPALFFFPDTLTLTSGTERCEHLPVGVKAVLTKQIKLKDFALFLLIRQAQEIDAIRHMIWQTNLLFKCLIVRRDILL